MSSTTLPSCDIPSSVQHYLRSHYERTKHLPAPNESYSQLDLHPHLQRITQQLIEYNVLQKIEMEELRGSNRWIYETHPRAYSIVEQYEPGGPVMPCGHRGFKNRGDHYECSFEECEEHFTRAEVEEAIDSD